jgi:iron(III) transport system permease protein
LFLKRCLFQGGGNTAEAIMSAKTATAANPLGLVAVIGLAIVVAVPFIFIVLQAIFPQIGQGVFSAPFVHLPALFEDPKLCA